MSDKQDIKAEMEEAAEKEASQYGKPIEGADMPPIVEPDHKEIQQAFKRNQYGDAELAVRLMRGRYCFDNTAQKAYYYNCTHWIKDINNNYIKEMETVSNWYEKQQFYYYGKWQEALSHMAQAEAQDKKAEFMGYKAEAKKYEKAHDAYATRVKGLRGIERVGSVWKLATSGPDSLGISGREWNRNPLLFPCKNCVIDLETGKALKGSPDQYFNRASSIEYHGMNVEAPEWDDLLEMVLRRDEGLLDYFGYFAGLSVTGLQTKDFFCAYGPEADNGKSVVFSLFEKIIGEFAGTLPIEMLLEEKFPRNPDGPSHSRLKLYGLRFASTSEAPQGKYFSLAKIKQFTSGGDRIEARGVSAKEEVEFDQTHTLVLHTNDLPRARGADNGFYRRLKVLPFRAKFIPAHEGGEDPASHIYHQVDRATLTAKIMRNAPGVLAYFVRNARRFIQLGDMPKPPEAVLAETKDYREEQDLVGQFLRECCELTMAGKEQMKNIHLTFRQWQMKERGFTEKEAWSQRALGDEFKKRPELKKIESNKVFYMGLRILPNWRWAFEGGE